MSLSVSLTSESFYSESFIGIGVTIGTDVFVRNFVVKTCRTIIDDTEKLDSIQVGFIHFQLLRFCQIEKRHKVCQVIKVVCCLMKLSVIL